MQTNNPRAEENLRRLYEEPVLLQGRRIPELEPVAGVDKVFISK